MDQFRLRTSLLSQLFEPLGDIGQGNREGLHGGEWVLEVQGVGVRIDPAKLHHLQETETCATRIEKFWRVSLYMTDDAIAMFYVM